MSKKTDKVERKPLPVELLVESFSMTRVEVRIANQEPQVRYFVNASIPPPRAQQMLTELIISVSKEEALATGKGETKEA